MPGNKKIGNNIMGKSRNYYRMKKALALIDKYWFMTGIVVVFTLTMIDPSGAVSGVGRALKWLNGTDAALILVFFLSGLVLDSAKLREGALDIKGTVLALLLIFIAAPLIGMAVGLMQGTTGIMIGIFIVAAMPTTISSGVVMTEAAGGNQAHALMITVIANTISIAAVPFALALVLWSADLGREVTIDRIAVMKKIGFLVLAPLFAGSMIQRFSNGFFSQAEKQISIANQVIVLGIVWMAFSQTRETVLSNLDSIVPAMIAVIMFHMLLLGTAFGCVKILKIPKGKRESVIFMGSQKTLPLSIIMQMSLFPDFGLALVVCVLHHATHLAIDAWLVERMKKA